MPWYEFSDGDLLGHADDNFLGPSKAFAAVGVDMNGAVIFDVNLGARFSDDTACNAPPGPIKRPILSGLMRIVSIRGA